jgi:predicted GNAT family acetyltransferase
MQIQHKQTENRGMFFIQPEGEEILAELIYQKHEGDKIILEHTQVDDELRGQNIGYQLVSAAVEYARTHHLKIEPVCTFAKAIIDKKPEFQDTLAQ